MPKIFISHSWEDNDVSRRLSADLKRDGADIWIDYARIAGGDSLPKQIGVALKWCDILLLVWSKSAETSYYVNLEWETALDMQKRIILCPLSLYFTSRLRFRLSPFIEGFETKAFT